MSETVNVALPNTSNAVEANYTGVEMARKGIADKTVKEVVLPEDSEVKIPSYLVDLRNVSALHRMAIDSIKSLVRNRATEVYEIPVYMYVKDKVVLIGYGKAHTLYSTLRSMCELQFNANVYLNTTGTFQTVTPETIFGLKLDL